MIRVSSIVFVACVVASLIVSTEALAAPPANDNWESAQEIAPPFAVSIDMSEAGAEFAEPQCWYFQERPSRTVWYRFVATSTDRHVVTATSPDASSGVGVYTGAALKELARTGCRTASAGWKARLAWRPVVGDTYYIQVEALSGSQGVVDFSFDIPSAPANDKISGAIEVPYAEPLDFEGISEENAGASMTDEPVASCMSPGDYPTVWYRFTTPAEVSAEFVFHAIPSWSSHVSAWIELTDGTLEQVGCAGAAPMKVMPQPSRTYLFQVADRWDGGAPMGLHLHPALANDDFEDASPITSLPFSYEQDVYNATRESGEPRGSCVDYAQGSIWFTYTAPADQVINIHPRADDWESWGVAYKGSSMSSLEEVGCTERYRGPLYVELRAGESIYIQTGYPYLDSSEITLTVADVAPASNDSPSSAQTISSTAGVLTPTSSQSVREARLSQGEQAPSCGPDPGSTVWYSFSPAVTTDVTFETSQTRYDTIIALYDETLQELACSDDVGSDFTSSITYEAEVGKTYLLSVSGAERQRGWLYLRTKPGSPKNDNFSGAKEIDSPPHLDAPSTLSATMESEEPQPSAACIGPSTPNKISFSVWYRFTPDEDMTLTASVFGNNLQTLVAVYTGDSLATLSEVACSGPTPDPAPGVSGARVQAATFQAQSGVTYYFQIGHRSTVGQRAVPFQLTRTEVP